MNEKYIKQNVNIQRQIEAQLNILQKLANESDPLKPAFNETERTLLTNICAKTSLINCEFFSEKIQEQIENCILKILQGIDVSDNLNQLNSLKTQYRENMPYNAAHMAGASTATFGFCLLIAAAVVFGLIGLPAGLVFFLPLLIIGFVSLATGSGLIKKGMIENERFFAEAGEKGRINEFINCIAPPEVIALLQKANPTTSYPQLKSHSDNMAQYQPSVYQKPRQDSPSSTPPGASQPHNPAPFYQ